jgi:hypothetical protein
MNAIPYKDKLVTMLKDIIGQRKETYKGLNIKLAAKYAKAKKLFCYAFTMELNKIDGKPNDSANMPLITRCTQYEWLDVMKSWFPKEK